MAQRILLKNHQAPGDAVVLTAAVRDLHRAYPDRFEVYVQTAGMDVWLNNPLVKPVWHLGQLSGHDRSQVLEINCENVAIDHSNQRSGHFIGSFHEDLECKLGLKIPVTEFKGDVHLTGMEMGAPSIDGKYWIIVAGGKADFTAKWWVSEYYQNVVDRNTKIRWVQAGSQSDHHPKLKAVIDRVGKTTIRQLMNLIYHAEGVVCPVTLTMHLAAAVPPKLKATWGVNKSLAPRFQFGPILKPCVVIAGGREAPHWEAYPGHRFIHTVGAMSCCAHGGCYRARTVPLNDGNPFDKLPCLNPVQLNNHFVPTCMTLITPAQVSDAIQSYYRGGMLEY